MSPKENLALAATSGEASTKIPLPHHSRSIAREHPRHAAPAPRGR